jgi:hypothetical protein
MLVFFFFFSFITIHTTHDGSTADVCYDLSVGRLEAVL